MGSHSHADVEKRMYDMNSQLLNEMVLLQKEIHELEDRIYSQEHSAGTFEQEEASEPFAFKRRLQPATVEKLQRKLPEVQDALDAKKQSVGLSNAYQYLIDDLINSQI